jgi:hypothetical protein
MDIRKKRGKRCFNISKQKVQLLMEEGLAFKFKEKLMNQLSDASLINKKDFLYHK